MRFYLRRASRNHYKANRSLVNGRDGPPVLSHFARPAVAPYPNLARSSLFPFGGEGAAEFPARQRYKKPVAEASFEVHQSRGHRADPPSAVCSCKCQVIKIHRANRQIQLSTKSFKAVFRKKAR